QLTAQQVLGESAGQIPGLLKASGSAINAENIRALAAGARGLGVAGGLEGLTEHQAVLGRAGLGLPEQLAALAAGKRVGLDPSGTAGGLETLVKQIEKIPRSEKGQQALQALGLNNDDVDLAKRNILEILQSVDQAIQQRAPQLRGQLSSILFG